MRSHARIRKATVALGATLAVFVLVSQPAFAHVEVSGDAPKGGFGEFSFSVPNERDDADTTEFEVKFPESAPLADASPQSKPGWTSKVTTRKLDTPVKNDDGEEITEVVDTITWSGGKIPAGEFDTFAVSGGPFPEDVDSLEFAAVQTYSNGDEVRWIQPTPASGEEPENPAPVLTLAAASGDEHDAGNPVTDTTTPGKVTPISTDDDDSSTSPVAVAGLVLAIVALGVGVAAIVLGRRKPTAA